MWRLRAEGGDGAGHYDRLYAVRDGSLEYVVESIEIHLVGGAALLLRKGGEHGGQVIYGICAVVPEGAIDLVVLGDVDIPVGPGLHLFRQGCGVTGGDDVLIAVLGPQRRYQLRPDLAAGACYKDSLHLTLRRDWLGRTDAASLSLPRKPIASERSAMRTGDSPRITSRLA